MEPTHNTSWERSLENLAQRFEYPETPDIAAGIGQRTTDHRPQNAAGWWSSVGYRLAWVAIGIAVLLVGALAVPQTRAALLSLFARIGAIDIFIDDTAPPVTPDDPKPTTAPDLTVSHSTALIALGRATTMDEARRLTDFALVVPAALGEPDEVYSHRDLPATTFVWRGEGGELLSLTEIGIAEFAMKLVGEDGARHVLVGDRPAVWIEGPHTVQLPGYREAGSLLIESNVLIWADDEITYRLEGDLSEEEMVEIAESLSH